MNTPQISLNVIENSQIAEARRRASEMAERAGLDASEVGKVALLVAELGTNLVKHAVGGELILRISGESSIEILSLDRGPGMADVSDCMRDGYSTAGSPGTGLGALRRISSECDIYSVAKKGTSILARVVGRNARNSAPQRARVGVICLAKAGEVECGDAWAVKAMQEADLCAVADGLGHGTEAARASTLALRYVCEQRHRSPKEILEYVHAGIRSTRGAALCLAQIRPAERLVRFAGVGNVAGAIVDGEKSRRMISLNGTLGYQSHRVTEFTYPWSETALLILHSDGLSSRWNLSGYPGLLARDPSLIAAVLYRDYARRTDDVTVLAVKARR